MAYLHAEYFAQHGSGVVSLLQSQLYSHVCIDFHYTYNVYNVVLFNKSRQLIQYMQYYGDILFCALIDYL